MPPVVRFEIQAEDPRRAIEFYSGVFGWDVREVRDGYWSIATGPEGEPGISGGLIPRRGPGPASGAPVNAFICTVLVDELDATIEAVTRAGGELVVPRMAIPGAGHVAYCLDTEGNVFGLFEDDPSVT